MQTLGTLQKAEIFSRLEQRNKIETYNVSTSLEGDALCDVHWSRFEITGDHHEEILRVRLSDLERETADILESIERLTAKLHDLDNLRLFIAKELEAQGIKLTERKGETINGSETNPVQDPGDPSSIE